MTRLSHQPPKRCILGEKRPEAQWSLQDAKARFSEVVRRVHRDGPQRVTVHGRDEVVIVSAAEYDRSHRGEGGAALTLALQASPYRETELTSRSVRAPVRDVSL